MTTAILGFVGVLAGGYVNNFIAVDYRRFRDAQGLAAALAGELNSHLVQLAWIVTQMQNLTQYAGKEISYATDYEIPGSPLFNANTTNIGLLGPDLAGRTAWTYDRLAAFRINWKLLIAHSNATKIMDGFLLDQSNNAVTAVLATGPRLVTDLKAFASLSYRLKWPMIG
ncbi:hypothetical protein [Caballeronia sp. HLA56]